jgi:hypothetical protein
MDPISQLAARYPWPDVPPSVPADDHGWFNGGSRRLLGARLNLETRCVVELGSWLGCSTRFLLDAAPHATVIAVDHWKGSEEHHQVPDWAGRLPTLYETFLVNCWRYRDRLIPVRESSLDGLQILAELGIKPDLVYVDAGHDTESVTADLHAIREYFPATRIVGDDWSWLSVRNAAELFARDFKLAIQVDENGWALEPG